jgi:TolA-binding protein
LFHDWQNELLASARFTDLHSLGQAESDALLKVASYDNAATEEIILNEAGEALTMSATAAKAYEQQDYEIALTTYQNIISRHSESILASHAHLGVASCQEALGKYEQAAESYEAYAGANRYCILYPYAVHGVARCREQLGQFDVARQIYQEFIEENAKSAWRLRAETAQLLLNRNERNHK